MVEKSAVRTSLKARARNVTSVFVATILAVGLISSASPAIAEELAPDAVEVSELVEEPQAADTAAPVGAEGAVPMAEIINGGITGVTTPVKSPVGNGWQVEFGCTWSVPAKANPGDTFSMTLPPELQWATSGEFPLFTTEQNPVIIATGTMVAGPPATVTFVLSDYFLTHRNGASGDCKFQTIFETTSKEDTISLDFDLESTVKPVIDIRNCPRECPEITKPTKGGWWTNSADHSRLTYDIRTSRTPVAGDVIIRDTPVAPDLDDNGSPDFADPGYVLECDVLTSFSAEAEDSEPVVPTQTGCSGEYAKGVYTEYFDDSEVTTPTYAPTVECDTSDPENQLLLITWPNLPAGVVVNAHYHATVTDPGRDAYANEAQVTMGDHKVHTTESVVLDNSPSGSGSGPGIHLEKWNDEGGDPTLSPAEDCDPNDQSENPPYCFAGDYDIAPGAALTPGEDTQILFTITNTGDQPLYNIEVTDALLPGTVNAITGLTCDFSSLGGPNSGTTWLETIPDDPADAFQPDDSFTCTGTLPGLAAGQQHSDRATVTANNMPGNDVNGNPIPETPVDDDDPWHGATPAIHLEKWNDEGAQPTLDETDFGGDYDVKPGLKLGIDSPTQIHFTITNTGAQPLFDVAVTDATEPGTVGEIQGLTCDFTEVGGPASGTIFEGPFLPGASFECVGTLEGLAAGSVHANVATVTASGPPRIDTEGKETPGVKVSDDDPWHGHTPAATIPPAATLPPSTPIPGLPVTGGQLAGGGITSIILLAAGTALVLMRRRRPSATS